FTYRGPGISGKVRIVPQRSRLRVHGEQEIVLGRTGQFKARLDLEPVLGRADHLDLYLSHPVGAPWRVQTNDPRNSVRLVSRLPALEALPRLLHLGGGHALAQASLAVALPRGELWRVQFTEPLLQKTALTLMTSLGPDEVDALLRRPQVALATPDPWSALVSLGV